MIRLLPHPSPLSHQQPRPAKSEKERQVADERRGGGGGRGAESYDRLSNYMLHSDDVNFVLPCLGGFYRPAPYK
jgi:hypothetical protein